MTKAIMLALAIGIIFGIGMSFAGGCAFGALCRTGEGHLRLWLALALFAWSGSTFPGMLSHWNVLTRESGDDNINFAKLGSQAYLPDTLGRPETALPVGLAILLLWYVWLRYNESTEKFTVV